MNPANLDLDTLRTLAVANDLGGYSHAAIRLGRSASAISLQMKRLQEDVGAPLFRKHGRNLALTETGEIVLRYGRRILALNDELLHTVRGASLGGTLRIGFSQDFAENILPSVLSQFTKLYPLVQIEIRIEGNTALVEAVEKCQLDLALAVGLADQPSAEVLGTLDLVWIAGASYSLRANQPLPLVLLGPQCSFRKRAIERLDQAGVPWRVAAVSPSLAGIWASAMGGLGITIRSSWNVPAKLVWHKELFDLPALGAFPVTLHSKGIAHEGAAQFRSMVREAVGKVLLRKQALATAMRSNITARA